MLFLRLLLGSCLYLLSAYTLSATSSDFSQLPPGLTQNNAPPVVMLTMPKDHQLFFKAYSDYEDITGDGIPETTFKPEIEYVGYFDNKLCYQYNASNKYYEPVAYAKQIVSGTAESNQISAASASANVSLASQLANNEGFYCNLTSGTTNQWSGNFLNWASMTKIDIIRHVLYGGKRAATQPSGLDGVLLERSQIPGDAHSFAKYYGASDLPFLTPYAVDDATISCAGKDNIRCPLVKKGITLCNTTYYSTASLPGDDHALSQSTTNASLIRVARGNFSLWATSERFQCRFKNSSELEPMLFTSNSAVKPSFSAEAVGGLNKLMEGIFGANPLYYIYHHSPSESIVQADLQYYEPAYAANASQKLGDFQSNIVACDKDFTAYSSKCTQYGSQLKPTGILQNADPNIFWGLMSGSFEHNKNGGALRKHPAQISSEVNTSGDFVAPSAGGIIAFLDSLRIANWGYSLPSVLTNNQRSTYVSWAGDNCGADENVNFGKLATFNDGQCRSWGNPFSEILMEAYNYLAGSTTPLVSSNDGQFFSGAAVQAMTSPSWSTNPLAVQPSSSSTLKSCSKLNVLAINGSSVSYDDETKFSSAKLTQYKNKTKTIGDNELIVGTNYFAPRVPESPAEGTAVCLPRANSAGAKIDLSSINGICPDAPALEGSYLMAGMAYEANTTSNINPKYGSGIQTSAISLSMGSAQIEIPTANNKVVLLPACRNKKTIGAAFLGSCSLVDFKIMTRSNSGDEGTYLVVWEDAQQGGDFDQDVIQLIKYSLTGNSLTVTTSILSTSTNDPMELGYNIAGVDSTLEGYRGLLRFNSSSDVTTNVSVYIPSNTSNKSLKSPLYYAAKWGGFKDLDKNGIISNSQEWDTYNNYSQEPNDPDGIPDNYSVVVNPDSLYADLTRLLKNIGPSVFSYATNGTINVLDDNSGFNVSTLFRPTITSDTNGVTRTLNWTSSLNIYARDANGYLHEDTNKNGQYDPADNIITFESEGANSDTLAKTHPANAKPTAANVLSSTPLSDLNFATPYWSAEQNLARVKNYSTQAAYTESRLEKRYIFTALDANNDNIINSSDLTSVPFDTSANGFPSSGANSTRARILDVTAATLPNIVNYIRGKESVSYRNRRIDFIAGYANDADDIAATTGSDSLEPWLLGDIVHSSPLVVGAPKSAYDRFFGDDTYTTFSTQYASRRHVVYVGANDGLLHAFNLGKFNSNTGQYSADTNYALGAELWAYAPYNLLPHLKWLTEKSYQHNYYVDGSPKSYDVNIFSNDADHPGGWGTILIVPMRTGGAAYAVDADGNGSKERTLRSAVIVMDITNPEVAPRLLAEISLPDNTYTTATPDVVKIRTRGSDNNFNGSGATNQWYLALASGVTDTKRFISNQAPRLYLYNLSASSAISLTSSVTLTTALGAVGGINARDWNGDFQDDYIYLGTVEGSVDAQAGRLLRVAVQTGGTLGTPSSVVNVSNQAFAATPFTAVDKQGNYWVFAGTGRYYTDEDNLYPDKQNSYYAVKETLTASGITATAALSDLANLSGVSIKTDDSLTQAVSIAGKTASNRTDLEAAITAAKGWYFNFPSTRSRNYTATILVNNALVFNTYEPGDACSPLGSSSQFKRDFLTGMPGKRLSTTVSTIDPFRTIGVGAASDPVPGKTPTSNTSLGAIDIAPPDDILPTSIRQAWRELPYGR